MDNLISRDQGFQKEKTQALCLCPELDLNELDYFKVIMDGHFMEETDPEVDQSLNDVLETRLWNKGGPPEKPLQRIEALQWRTHLRSPLTYMIFFFVFYCTFPTNLISMLRYNFLIVIFLI